METTTRSFSARAARIRERCPSCRAPMVGTRPTARAHGAPGPPPRSPLRTSAIVDTHGRSSRHSIRPHAGMASSRHRTGSPSSRRHPSAARPPGGCSPPPPRRRRTRAGRRWRSRPVASTNMASPSTGVCTGLMARAMPVMAMRATMPHCSLSRRRRSSPPRGSCSSSGRSRRRARRPASRPGCPTKAPLATRPPRGSRPVLVENVAQGVHHGERGHGRPRPPTATRATEPRHPSSNPPRPRILPTVAPVPAPTEPSSTSVRRRRGRLDRRPRRVG